MALYTNVAKVRKLVSVRRVRTWINPGEQVDLDPSDVRHLGGNSAYIQLADGICFDIFSLYSPAGRSSDHLLSLLR